MSDTSLPRMGGGVDLSALQHKHEQHATTVPTNSGVAVLEVTPQNLQSAVVDASNSYPIVLAVFDPATPTSKQLLEVLHAGIGQTSGKLQLATVDAKAYPEIVQAMQIQELPVTVAALQGRLLPLFAGVPDQTQVGQVLAQVLQAAAQAGVTGQPPVAEASGQPDAAPERVLTPTQQQAYAAMEAGDWEQAVTNFAKAVEENPRDLDSERALAQAQLLFRGDHPDSDEILAAADAAFNGGDIPGAMRKLLTKLATVFGDERKPYQSRLVDYFTIVGAEDPQVVAARRELAQLLY